MSNSINSNSSCHRANYMDEIFSNSQSKNKNIIHSSKPSRQVGQKRRFRVAGIVNVLLTNLALQLLLVISMVEISLATLVSQLINSFLGYAIYGKMVFRAQGLKHHRPLLRYLTLMIAMWLLNTAAIRAGETIGFHKKLPRLG